MAQEYRQSQDRRNREKITTLRKELPPFMGEYLLYLLEVRQLSTRTVLGYAQDLEVFCFFLTQSTPILSVYQDITPSYLNELKPQDISEYLSFLSLYERDGVKWENTESGKARKLSALKSFWKWMIGMELLEKNPTLLIVSPRMKKKEIIKLEEEEIREVMHGIETGSGLKRERSRKYSNHIFLRDLALISLLLGTGIRVSECVGIDVTDLSLKENSVKVIRKGGNEHRVYFSESVKRRILEYMRKERQEPIDGSNALFVSTQRKRMSVRSVERRVQRYTEGVVEGKRISAHKLRSTYATQVYRKSHDIYMTADALGHSSIQSTSRYSDIGNERRREAASYTEFLDSADT